MFSVTDLATYLYCPRKLYLQQVLEFPEPPSEILLLGSINHAMFDKINKLDESIVSSITESTNIKELYSKTYFTLLKSILKEANLKEFALKSLDVFHDTWPRFQEEAELRADNVLSFIQKNNIYGKALWEKLTPKYLTEIKLYSEKLELKGIIDRLELTEGSLIPYELKTGSPPRDGVWPGQKIQLISYMLLAKENMGKTVTHGFIHFIKTNENRKIILNPFSEIEVKNTIAEIKEILNAESPPEILENKNKCNACSLKEECYKINQNVQKSS
ncbi:MAG: CRISPR-associated protein Cas4 [Nanoarchaeota archaeon]